MAVVATAMKKARLLIDTLVINSFMGGVFFTAGGMLHVMIQAYTPGTFESNPGFIFLLQGCLYPIGLFYVVIMGVDLFNSNILFFSVGVARGAVSVVDLVISWMVSWWFNLVGTIFVCYIFCHYSAVTTHPLYVTASRDILETKMSYSFVETMIKAMAGNFFVCLAIYLQLMAKPLHVKFLMMLLPIFTFVSMGFTHSVADMYMIVIGLINGANVSVGDTAWKLFLPGVIGNIIGGSFFGLVVPWYLHLFVVERDQKLLNLPRYEVRDEQPELNQDSRVVRVPEHDEQEVFPDIKEENTDVSSLSSTSHNAPDHGLVRALSHVSTYHSTATRRPTVKSPANVFPVYGMGSPAERERSIASGRRTDDPDLASQYSTQTYEEERANADFIGQQIRRTLSRVATRTKKDIEAQPSGLESRPSQSGPSQSRPSVSSISFPKQLQRFSFNGNRTSSHKDLDELNSRFSKAGITMKAANAANEAAGTSDLLQNNALPIMMVRSPSGVSPNARPENIPSTASSVRPYDPST